MKVVNALMIALALATAFILGAVARGYAIETNGKFAWYAYLACLDGNGDSHSLEQMVECHNMGIKVFRHEQGLSDE